MMPKIRLFVQSVASFPCAPRWKGCAQHREQRHLLVKPHYFRHLRVFSAYSQSLLISLVLWVTIGEKRSNHLVSPSFKILITFLDIGEQSAARQLRIYQILNPLRDFTAQIVCVSVRVCRLFGSLCVFRILRPWPLSISVAAVMCDCL